jgi:hypothetical protein
MSDTEAAPQHYSISEIRHQRRVGQVRVALLRRQIDTSRRMIAALAKMEAGIAELQQADRELEALPEPCGTGWPG